MDILTTIRPHVPLTAHPNGTWRGTCPFCERAQLIVRPGKADWLCRGCGANGTGERFDALWEDLTLRRLAGGD